MQLVVTGSRGMLGHDLVAAAERLGHAVIALDIHDLDLTDREAVRGHFGELVSALGRVDAVVNCAAWTAVDDAETHEETAHRINADAAGFVAEAARELDSRIVQISTDYVFDGSAITPYDEDAPVSPASAYGRTKAAGEDAVRRAHPDGHLVVRTAWLYGAHGPCFPRTIARLVRERGAIDVVDDQRGQPTWTVDVSHTVLRLLDAGAPAGTYHATADGEATWCEFAREVVASAGLDPSSVRPTDSASFTRPAARPAYSVLGHRGLDRAGLPHLGHWLDRWRVAADKVLDGLD